MVKLSPWHEIFYCPFLQMDSLCYNQLLCSHGLLINSSAALCKRNMGTMWHNKLEVAVRVLPASNEYCIQHIRTIHVHNSYLYEDRRSPMLLGFFLQPHIEEFHEAQPTTQFLWTSDQEKDIREGKWGALGASLSMIGHTVYIVASSNGFLLCSIEREPQMHYCACNPITKEWVALPKTHKIYMYVALAFICEGNHTSLDGVHFTVVRAGVSNPQNRSIELEVETFSSDTASEWKESTILCASPFTLAVANRPGFVVDKIIYWKDLRSLLVAYNPTKKCVDLIELPDAQNVVCWGDLFGLSEGVIHYARHNNFYLEVWVLKKAQWERTHKLSFARMFRQHGLNEYKGLSMKAFHPFDYR
ncbi:uncharacterized protein LOC130783879 [Actinidia eriantha]|uniref:uncharacterized protein LOC130783879 n=1 Tax=Actinidia eriantha TaxID=165200 RepID=UPI002585E9A8|nr:uncharacterized protein LOC130783879 [Actinidia eriantha]